MGIGIAAQLTPTRIFINVWEKRFKFTRLSGFNIADTAVKALLDEQVKTHHGLAWPTI